MKIVCSLLLFCLSFTLASAQDPEQKKYMDSLEAYLGREDDSLKLSAISDLAWEYNTIDVNRAILLNFMGLSIANKLHREYAAGQAYSDLGTSYYFKRDFDSSEYFYLKALSITQKINDTIELASLYNKLGALYKERGEYQTSLNYSFLSLKIYQALKNQHKMALLYNNIGVSYEELKNFRMAESYYQKALRINEEEKSKSGIARNYLGLGNVNLTKHQTDEAYKYYQKAAEIFRELEWGVELSVALNNMGDVLDQKQQYEQSLQKRQEALQIAQEIEDVQSQAKYHLYISDVLMKIKRFPAALQHILAAQKLSGSIKSSEIEMDLYELYSKYYFGAGNFEKGSEYLGRFHNLKDSVYSAELSRNIASMEVKHNTQQLRLEKAETEASNLRLKSEKMQARQQRNYILTGTCIVLLIAIGIFYQSRQQLKRVEERKRINAMLHSEEEERSRIARDLHDGLGQILSTARINAAALEGSVDTEDEPILQTTVSLLDQSIVELRAISHNLMPQALADNGLNKALEELASKLNIAKHTQLSLNVSDNFPVLEKSIQIILYRVIQEIVNNMLKHAQALLITIQLNERRQGYSILLQDNGKGFDTALAEKSEGIGWRNIKTRLSLINAQLLLSSEPGKGTRALIEGEI